MGSCCQGEMLYGDQINSLKNNNQVSLFHFGTSDGNMARLFKTTQLAILYCESISLMQEKVSSRLREV